LFVPTVAIEEAAILVLLYVAVTSVAFNSPCVSVIVAVTVPLVSIEPVAVVNTIVGAVVSTMTVYVVAGETCEGVRVSLTKMFTVCFPAVKVVIKVQPVVPEAKVWAPASIVKKTLLRRVEGGSPGEGAALPVKPTPETTL